MQIDPMLILSMLARKEAENLHLAQEVARLRGELSAQDKAQPRPEPA